MTGRTGQLAIHAVIVSLGSGTATGASVISHCRSNRSSLFVVAIMIVPLSFNHQSRSLPLPFRSLCTPFNPLFPVLHQVLMVVEVVVVVVNSVVVMMVALSSLCERARRFLELRCVLDRQ